MSTAQALTSFIHRLEAAQERGYKRTLLLLHPTGGNENSLIGLGRELDYRAALLSPRGKVLEGDKPRFFRRFAEGVFDLEDMKFRTNELADFVESAEKVYHLDPAGMIAVGYSNGANIAVSMLLLRPHVLAGAVLFRPMLPIVPDLLPDLSNKPIFISAGTMDSLVQTDETERLVKLLRESGAKVTLHWTDVGHELHDSDIDAAKEWLDEI